MGAVGLDDKRGDLAKGQHVEQDVREAGVQERDREHPVPLALDRQDVEERQAVGEICPHRRSEQRQYLDGDRHADGQQEVVRAFMPSAEVVELDGVGPMLRVPNTDIFEIRLDAQQAAAPLPAMSARMSRPRRISMC